MSVDWSLRLLSWCLNGIIILLSLRLLIAVIELFVPELRTPQ